MDHDIQCLWVLYVRIDVNDDIFSNIYLEQRRRTRFLTFATEARQCMGRYDPLVGLFGYTPVEMMEELQAVVEGLGFSWHTRLQRTIKKDWVALKGKFLNQYIEDPSSVMVVVDEL
ncbi:hypothetical protein BC941DRAFT_469150 [Chlamydoabsidia padenii]|nr:hypothetical protein BC941DRAFT_469150 [Chlamydoabsidia padenii]